MEALIWIGAIMTLAGVAGLGLCIRQAMSARKGGLDEAEMQARLRKAMLLNFGALGLSAFGLALVVVGILLR